MTRRQTEAGRRNVAKAQKAARAKKALTKLPKQTGGLGRQAAMSA